MKLTGNVHWLILAYLGPLALIPLFRAPADPVVRWHARHGLVLYVVEVLATGAFLAVGGVLSFFFGALALAVAFLGLALALFALVLHGLLIAHALMGEGLVLPGVTRFLDRF